MIYLLSASVGLDAGAAESFWKKSRVYVRVVLFIS